MQEINGYFDYAAATPLLPESYKAMEPYLTDRFYNPSALYLEAKYNKRSLDNARESIANCLGARPTEIIFTAGGTEANNLAMSGVINNFLGCNIITSAIEHESILSPAEQYNHFLIGVNNKGVVNLSELEESINELTVLVSIQYVNNEIGTIQPIHEITRIINEIKQKRFNKKNNVPIYLHIDACQAVNYLDMHVSRLGADLITINSGKIYGPKQCGVLYVKTGVKLSAMIRGGGQEYNLRSGSENLANIIGFASSLDRAVKNRKSEFKRLSLLRDGFIDCLVKNHPNISINGPIGEKRIANNIHILIPGYDNERLLMMLDEQGFMVATGSACNASDDQPSHVLKAIGLSNEQSQNCIRITLGRYTTKENIASLLNCLDNILD